MAVGPPFVPREAFVSRLQRLCTAFGELRSEQAEKLYQHYALLLRWNPVAGLTSVWRLEDAVERHYGESLFLASLLPAGSFRILDLGSGGGFPGIPIAVYRPGWEVWLCERRLKKAAFLKEATRGWKNVFVISDPKEGPKEVFDWLVSRAVRAEQVLKIGLERAHGIGLLTTKEYCRVVGALAGFEWIGEYSLPWGGRRVCLLGRVADPPRLA